MVVNLEFVKVIIIVEEVYIFDFFNWDVKLFIEQFSMKFFFQNVLLIDLGVLNMYFIEQLCIIEDELFEQFFFEF